jgi:hypothetical protein
MTTSMTPLQREAMRRAIDGDWELADAMELVERGRGALSRHGQDYTLLFGLWVGGRLRQFVWGDVLDEDDEDYEDDEDDEDELVAALSADHDISLVTDLNDNVLFDCRRGDPLPLYVRTYPSRTPLWAHGVLAVQRRAQHTGTQLHTKEISSCA